MAKKSIFKIAAAESITTSENWKEPFEVVIAQWGDAAGFMVTTTLIPGPN